MSKFLVSGKSAKGRASETVGGMPADIDGRVEKVELAVIPLRTKSEYVEHITALWVGAQERFLVIGKYLVNARATLPHGEYEDMVERELPFGTSVAHRLRTVAEAVDARRIAEAECPKSYAAAYLIARMSDSELSKARERGLIQPMTPRSAVEAFRRELQGPPSPDRRREDLERRKRSLLDQLRRIEEELAWIGGSAPTIIDVVSDPVLS
ncbi:MAG: hypothetical protein WCO00_11080 [Rhodospirillaceae bacterium]